MEPRFGHDFGSVRVHDDTRADAASTAVGARAFTVGTDIVFRRGEFVPHTQAGRTLLAHELAHVAQRQHGQPRLFRQPAVIEPHYPTEEEQREIEKRLSREFKGTEATPPTAPGEPAVQRGRSLNEAERQALANRLRRPYFDTIASLDTGPSASSGALNEAEAFDVVTEAREAIFKRFGSYASRRLTLTQAATTTTGASRRAADQLLVIFQATSSVVHALARTIATTHCKECLTELAGLDVESKQAVIDALIDAAQQERREQLQRVATARVPGSFSRAESRVSMRLKPRQEFYHTAVHELIHALAHPAFTAAFGDEDNINEGFTEYFTRQVASDSSSYQTQYEKVVSARDAMKGPFLLATVGGEALEESMRMAYFRGRLDLIGWRPSGPEEEKSVKEADVSAKPWDAASARRYAAIYRTQAQAKQGASRNVLGMGLFFAQGPDDNTIAVRYARVIAQTEPYARGQLLLEGQLLGSPVQNPRALGASLGIAAEYQEPFFYAGGGVRFVGTAAPAGGAERLDASPFVGAGIRAWQTIRVGAEGFVLLPVTGQDIGYGAGITLGVEFGRK